MGRDWVYNVDTQATEYSISGEIDTSTATSPVTILTPTIGKAISTRGAHVFSSSTTGEVTVYYTNSGKVIVKLYCSRFYQATLPRIKIDGSTDETVSVSWTDLSTGAKIFYLLAYKEI